MILKTVEINYGTPLYVSTEDHDGWTISLVRGLNQIDLHCDELNEIIALTKMLGWETT